MGDGTGIQWTDVTWNPVRGCSIVSAGCENCYAMRQAHRGSRAGGPYEGLTRSTDHGPKWTGKIRLVEDKLDQPLRWQKPRRIFVNSMSDLFHEDVPDEYIERVFAVMALASHHTFQILTKRPERMRKWATGEFTDAMVEGAAQKLYHERTGEDPSQWLAVQLPLDNVWVGVSVENQEQANRRLPHLLQTPAAVRFLSCEPLLGAVNAESVHYEGKIRDVEPGVDIDYDVTINALTGDAFDGWDHVGEEDRKIDWVIVGGESGPRARPCEVSWIRSLVKQCKAAKVPVFVKQLGRFPMLTYDDWMTCPLADRWTGPEKQAGEPRDPSELGTMTPIDSKGGDVHGWPRDLNVREFPATREERRDGA